MVVSTAKLKVRCYRKTDLLIIIIAGGVPVNQGLSYGVGELVHFKYHPPRGVLNTSAVILDHVNTNPRCCLSEQEGSECRKSVNQTLIQCFR